MRLVCVCLYFKNYLKIVPFITLVKFANIKRCDSEKKLEHFVLTFIIISISDNFGRKTLHCVSLVTDRRILVYEYYQYLVKQLEIDLSLVKQLEIDLSLICKTITEIR